MAIALRELEQEYREYLPALVMSVCLDGHCYALAIALSRGTGWPIVALMQNGAVRHAAVQRPGGWFHDARGIVNYEEFGEPFGLASPYELKRITEQDLFGLASISEFWISSITKKIQAIWPDLPWKQPTLRDRALAFAQELEALSRKHRLWIRAPRPAALPLICEEAGGESGYELQPTMDGTEYMINRLLQKQEYP